MNNKQDEIHIKGYAKFDCKDKNKRKYRYLLRRKWDEILPQVTFIMLNPSTADHEKNDPTLRRCINFAKSWDYGSLEVVNLFAYITPKRKELLEEEDPIGPKNNLYIQSAARRAKSIIVAWGGGKFPKIMNRNEEVLSVLTQIPDKKIYFLGDSLTKDGHPRHPLPRGQAIKGRTIFDL